MIYMFIPLIVLMISWVDNAHVKLITCTCQTYQIVYIKHVQLLLCISYTSMKLLKKKKRTNRI